MINFMKLKKNYKKKEKYQKKKKIIIQIKI